ncbi:MAG: phosphate ABC transporter substrate-binding protein [Planctomycetaceae bacterium]|nr:phosphate ABC transporter substrate-binding protein [Planctomycetaceae bacterium]
MSKRNILIACLSSFFLLTILGCGSRQNSKQDSSSNTIRVEGSDTMVNLAQAWAEKYQTEKSEITIVISGGGSGVGISSLTQGLTDMANASRKMKDKEIRRAKNEFNLDPQEFTVGKDALAIYVHKDNPLEEITIAELTAIYGEGGATNTWTELGVSVTGTSNQQIVRVSRQNNSGTYAYFRQYVLDDNDFKLGSIDLSGSADVVSMVEKTLGAIGYSGMGYATDGVKMLKVKIDTDSPSVAPNAANVTNGTYPISRPLLIYTPTIPTGIVKDYLDWILGTTGQSIIEEMGYVPVQ